MAETFMDNDYWAKKKGFTQFLTDDGDGYEDKNKYPPADTLDLFREDAYGLIITEADGVPELDDKYLRNLEYRMVELMIDEEQGRTTEDGRPIYIPRDYMYERDRTKVGNAGTQGFTRRILIV